MRLDVHYLRRCTLIIVFLVLLRDDQVQHSRCNSSHEEWCAEDDGDGVEKPLQTLIRVIHSIEKMSEDRRHEQVANAEGQGGCEDEPIPPCELDIGEHAEPRHRDRCKEECGDATENRVGNYGIREVRNACGRPGLEAREDVLARKTPEIFPRTPKRMRKKQQNRPAVRLAHRVIAITPLFCQEW